MADYEIFLPEDSSPGSCIATFATCLNAIGLELGLRINSGMTTQFGSTWFNELEELRVEEAADQGRPYRRSWSYYDISWIVNEPFHNSQSPIRKFLPAGVKGFYDDLKDMVSMRNQWFHDYSHHSISNLKNAVSLFRYVAQVCELELASQIVEVEKRVVDISNGDFKKSTNSSEFEAEKVSINNQGPVKQKAVGAVWIADPGQRKLELKESGALIDPAQKKNVIQEMTEAQKAEYLPLWKSQIRKGWLFVDDWGQVGSYVGGELRMVGLFGENAIELDEDPFSKFLLPKTYLFDGESIVDRVSGEKLSLDSADKVTASTVKRVPQLVGANEPIRCTWDGELIHYGDAGPVYVGEIDFDSWFDGHKFF